MDKFLKKNDVSLDFVLNSLQNPIIVINSKEKTINYCNLAAENFLDMSKKKILGKKIDNIFPIDSHFISLINKSIDTKRDVKEIDTQLDTLKKRYKISISISKLDEADGFLSIIIYDLTANSELSKKYKFENSSQSITPLISMLSHEIKNPLSGIKGAAQLIKKRASFNNNKDFFLTKLIDSEAERIKSLINNLESFTDQRPVKKSMLNINQVLRYVKNSAEAIYNKKNILFYENYDPSLPKILGNKEQLIQLFLNLIINSCDEVDNKEGVIKIGSRYKYEKLPIEIYVEDNGNGIAENLKDSIFDPFVTDKVNGKGLGLSIAAKIVNSHNGTIEFDSYSGRTIFKVMFQEGKKI